MNYVEKMSSERYFVQWCHTRTARHRRSHINEAKCTSRKRFSTARATRDFRFGWWTTHTILTKASALVRHWGAAVGDWFATKITTHKHLQSKWKKQFSSNQNGIIKSDTNKIRFKILFYFAKWSIWLALSLCLHVAVTLFGISCYLYLITFFLIPLILVKY